MDLESEFDNGEEQERRQNAGAFDVGRETERFECVREGSSLMVLRNRISVEPHLQTMRI
jgi:hypothetical protein